MTKVSTLKVKVAIRSEVKIVSQHLLKTNEGNLKKLHRKIENIEKVCRVQELGSYAQGQGHNQVRCQIVSKFVLLLKFCSIFDETKTER